MAINKKSDIYGISQPINTGLLCDWSINLSRGLPFIFFISARDIILKTSLLFKHVI